MIICIHSLSPSISSESPGFYVLHFCMLHTTLNSDSATLDKKRFQLWHRYVNRQASLSAKQWFGKIFSVDPFCPYFVKRTENSMGFISLIQLRPRRKRLGLAPSRDSSLNLTPCCEGNRTDGQRMYGEAGVRWPESCLFTGMMETEPASPPRHKRLSFDGLLPTGSLDMNWVPPWLDQWALATVQRADLLS